jgi:CDGSH-type Zn-finger protein
MAGTESMEVAAELRALIGLARDFGRKLSGPELARLHRSVIRPLGDALAGVAGGAAPEPDGSGTRSPAELTWELAKRTTRLRCEPGVPAPVAEATAALRELSATLAPAEAEARAAELTTMLAALPAGIQVQADGPYLVTNSERLRSWLGEEIPAAPQLALCRCGQSALKPLCDGTHAEIGFTDGKDPNRVADKLESYAGLEVTVLDNRGTCAHSGFCTDRLATVFRLNEEPFVAPAGGRMDEIMRAVRACPSGALSYAIDGREAREQVDQPRAPSIEVSKDGLYRITGGIPLVDDRGDPVARNAGASLEHYSLGRCGQSQNKPFCSGMHWHVDFQDPPPSEAPTLFEWAGGFPALERMTHIFYERHVPQDPLLAPLFAEMSPDHPERVAAWLGETFGGPQVCTPSATPAMTGWSRSMPARRSPRSSALAGFS